MYEKNRLFWETPYVGGAIVNPSLLLEKNLLYNEYKKF